MCKSKKRFSDHFDTLIALISHMAMMEYTSRTPSNLAKFLSLDEIEVKNVLANFKGIFRESVNCAENSLEHYYCLQIRYATRKSEKEGAKEDLIQLKAEYLNTLLEFVAKMVDIEKTDERQVRTNIVALIASALALVASIGAAIIAFFSAAS